MEEEDKENEEEIVKHAIWETLHENQHLSLELALFDESSNNSNSSSVGLEIDTQEPSTSTKTPSKKRKVCEPMPKELENMEEEIEEQLGDKAKKSKLTVLNVKNILKHVITNKHVMAMVKQSMRETEGANSSDEDCPYEPKLTRAKTKELLNSQTTYPWPVTPAKQVPVSETKKLMDAELPEDEDDDEEYQPVEEEDVSEDEGASLASDLEPLTPQPVTPLKAADCGTQTAWSEDGLFRLPPTEAESLGNIGQRTRSKFSLSNTALETIEQSFVPPDITTDMYDLECDNEDWREFLEEFTQPLNSAVNDTLDDDEADPEYNILSDEEAEDKEELRADRAVKVSKKELNELISELMEYMEPSDEEGDPANDSLANQGSSTPRHACSFAALQTQREESQGLPQTLPPDLAMPVQKGQEEGQYILPDITEEQPPAAVAPAEVGMSTEQRKLLKQQMAQHVQLLAQSYMQSSIIPEMKCCCLDTKENLMSLRFLNGSNKNSAFYCPNLDDAVETVNEWDEILQEDNPKFKEMKKFVEEESQRKAQARRAKKLFSPRHSRVFLDHVSESKAFIYPLLLPHQPFCSRCDVPKHLYFTKSENVLLVFGLEQFLPYIEQNSELHSKKKAVTMKKVSDLISEFILPAKTSKAIEIHISTKKRASKENVISEFFFKNKVPTTMHFVINAQRLAPCEQPQELLPEIWRQHIYEGKISS